MDSLLQSSNLILLGSTGSGKSTLANMLLGKTLYRKQFRNDKVIFCNESDSFEIGHEQISKTKEAQPKFLKQLECQIFDTPGLCDTVGAYQRCLNSLSILKAIKQSKYVKLIVVIPYETLKVERGNGLFTCLKQSLEFFKDNEQIKDSVLITITKVKKNCQPGSIIYEIIDICRERLADIEESIQFQETIDKTREQPNDIKKLIQFVQYIYQNGRVCLFHKPKLENDSDSPLDYANLRNQFYQKIQTLRIYKVNKLHISLDHQTLVYLQENLKNETIQEGNSNILEIKGDLVCLNSVQDLIQKEIKSNDPTKIIRVRSAFAIVANYQINAPSFDIILISPLLIMKQDICIDLQGHPGKDQQLQKRKELKIGTTGANGLPGMPGFNGGQLCIACDEIIDDDPDKYYKFTVNLSGGKGGSGQNGQDGTEGKQGKSGNIEQIEKLEESCVIKREELKFVDKSWNQKWLHIVKLMLTFNKQYKETYESKFEEPIDGGNGGSGGKGGIGGLSGNIKFTNLQGQPNNELINRLNNVQQIQGQTGENGKPGKPGISGCTQGDPIEIFTFRGIYINERVFPQYRKKISSRIQEKQREQGNLDIGHAQNNLENNQAMKKGSFQYNIYLCQYYCQLYFNQIFTPFERYTNLFLKGTKMGGYAFKFMRGVPNFYTRFESTIYQYPFAKQIFDSMDNLGTKIVPKETFIGGQPIGVFEILKGSLKSAAVNFGIFLFISLVNTYISSRWEVKPYKQKCGSSKPGKENGTLNEEDQEQPIQLKEINFDIEQQLFSVSQHI